MQISPLVERENLLRNSLAFVKKRKRRVLPLYSRRFPRTNNRFAGVKRVKPNEQLTVTQMSFLPNRTNEQFEQFLK